MGYDPECDEAFARQADKALESFLQFSATDRLTISKYVYANCKEFLDEVGFDLHDQPLHNIKEDSEIWNFIHPKEIYVSRRDRRDRDIYILVACECDWEKEHGLQLVFRQGKKLTRVSAQDGHLTEADADDKPDDQDALLSRFSRED